MNQIVNRMSCLIYWEIFCRECVFQVADVDSGFLPDLEKIRSTCCILRQLRTSFSPFPTRLTPVVIKQSPSFRQGETVK
ncbi:hypothetical protein R1flu_017020 [Riccia fluitans]|uniref:Uncharacterized protein n=1 Tax=Riccia fluitans TaxID=41844 RepID=A0ABD1YRJ5_9MARC